MKFKRLESDFVLIDFARNAESMGARTWPANTPDEVRQSRREARAEQRTSVIVVQTEKYRYAPGSQARWDTAAAEASRDPVTQKIGGESGEGRRTLQRFHY